MGFGNTPVGLKMISPLQWGITLCDGSILESGGAHGRRRPKGIKKGRYYPYFFGPFSLLLIFYIFTYLLPLIRDS